MEDWAVGGASEGLFAEDDVGDDGGAVAEEYGSLSEGCDCEVLH